MSKQKRKPKTAAAHPRNWPICWPYDIPRRTLIVTGANILLLLALGVTAMIGLRKLDVQVRGLPVVSRDAPQIKLADLPDWMPRDLREQLTRQASATIDNHLFEKPLVDRLALHMAQSPWVNQVNKVRKQYGNIVTVDCRYREPVALVRDRGGLVLVDREAIRLPAEVMRRSLASMDLLLIQGVSAAAPHTGALWLGEDLLAGLALADLIKRQRYAEQIAAINVNNFGGRDDPVAAHLELLAHDGTHIRWGLPPFRESWREASTAQKLVSLEYVFDTLDTRHSPVEYIDVRQAKVRYRPLAQSRASTEPIPVAKSE